eukprot:CAMPEP_0194271118 /NCGR_PEP_ID=MMETSP0169-20130528/4984_1 /TAXON_ID=218684 /ORGANISM="Corethron pennatum, Strain L29A3" /LENGTH=589 /DNA_ID=CAMNT_0039013397 /DNA_START=166 /DNA_END=1935 /DNA_ORIENTATION=-
MNSVRSSRLRVAQQLQTLAEGTPISGCVNSGKIEQDSQSGSRKSYVTIADALDQRSTVLIDKFRLYVIDYTVEWKKILKNRVTQSLAAFEKTRLEYDHYQRKMSSMRKTVTALEKRGKPIDPALNQKIFRNEEKLEETKASYFMSHRKTVLFLKEVTERSWKDLHPLFVKLAQFDCTFAKDQATISSDLNGVISILQKIALDNGMSKTARLKNLMYADPEEIYTGLPLRKIGTPNKTLSVELGSAEDLVTEAQPHTTSALVLYEDSEVNKSLSKPNDDEMMPKGITEQVGELLNKMRNEMNTPDISSTLSSIAYDFIENIQESSTKTAEKIIPGKKTSNLDFSKKGNKNNISDTLNNDTYLGQNCAKMSSTDCAITASITEHNNEVAFTKNEVGTRTNMPASYCQSSHPEMETRGDNNNKDNGLESEHLKKREKPLRKRSNVANAKNITRKSSGNDGVFRGFDILKTFGRKPSIENTSSNSLLIEGPAHLNQLKPMRSRRISEDFTTTNEVTEDDRKRAGPQTADDQEEEVPRTDPWMKNVEELYHEENLADSFTNIATNAASVQNNFEHSQLFTPCASLNNDEIEVSP